MPSMEASSQQRSPARLLSHIAPSPLSYIEFQKMLAGFLLSLKKSVMVRISLFLKEPNADIKRKRRKLMPSPRTECSQRPRLDLSLS